FPKRFLPRERWDEAAMAQAKKEIEKHLAIVEQQLAGREWMVGGRYSLVEVCYAPFVEFFPLMEITPPPAVAAWAAGIVGRPTARDGPWCSRATTPSAPRTCPTGCSGRQPPRPPRPRPASPSRTSSAATSCRSSPSRPRWRRPPPASGST